MGVRVSPGAPNCIINMKKIGQWFLTDEEQELENPMYNFASNNDIGSNAWQENYTEYLLDFVPKNRRRNCIDIGASYGFFTASFANVFENVFAFEINPFVNECLTKNMLEFDNIKIMNIGLSNCRATVELSVNLKLTGSGSINYCDSKNHKLNGITDTLDNFNLPDVDLIKIDVEGHEFSVLQGAIDTIKQNSPILVIEMFTHRCKMSDKNRKECISFLRNLNYEIMDVRQHDFVFQRR